MEERKELNQLDLGKVNDFELDRHTSSVLHPDTLFSFMKKVDYLVEIIENKSIPARYCVEDISYLGIKSISKVAIPMRCFCDIKLHELQYHVDFYGKCGIAFKKSWGMKNGIQPIHYINPRSKLKEDFSVVFNNAIDKLSEQSNELQNELANFILHELMYYKADSGKFENRNTEQLEEKCFTDECEWRFIADVKKIGYETIILGEETTNKDYLNTLSDSLKTHKNISLNFEYSEIKYLIVENESDYSKMVDAIINLNNTDKSEKTKLLSKIIIWNDSEGDF